MKSISGPRLKFFVIIGLKDEGKLLTKFVVGSIDFVAEFRTKNNATNNDANKMQKIINQVKLILLLKKRFQYCFLAVVW
ncbi:Uncharacterised protein, partial [Metamycoplasma alkalescens]